MSVLSGFISETSNTRSGVPLMFTFLILSESKSAPDFLSEWTSWMWVYIFFSSKIQGEEGVYDHVTSTHWPEEGRNSPIWFDHYQYTWLAFSMYVHCVLEEHIVYKSYSYCVLHIDFFLHCILILLSFTHTHIYTKNCIFRRLWSFGIGNFYFYWLLWIH